MRTKEDAQKLIDSIVEEMIKSHFPVEATHKMGYRENSISADGYTWGNPEYFTDSVARILVGGWFSKSALVKLAQILLDRMFKETRS